MTGRYGVKQEGRHEERGVRVRAFGLACGNAGNAWNPDMMDPTRSEKAAWAGRSSQCMSPPWKWGKGEGGSEESIVGSRRTGREAGRRGEEQ